MTDHQSSSLFRALIFNIYQLHHLHELSDTFQWLAPSVHIFHSRQVYPMMSWNLHPKPILSNPFGFSQTAHFLATSLTTVKQELSYREIYRHYMVMHLITIVNEAQLILYLDATS